MNLPRKDYWEHFISNTNLDVLAKDLNESWDSKTLGYTKQNTIDDPALDILNKNYGGNNNFNILDFGCGLGRNSDYLVSISNDTYSFDLPAMVEKNKKVKNSPNIYSDWSKIPLFKIQVVYECTVFQHLDYQILDAYIKDISEHCGYLYSQTRVYNDCGRDFRNATGGINIARAIQHNKSFIPVYCSIPLEEAKSRMDETHYSILYKIVK